MDLDQCLIQLGLIRYGRVWAVARKHLLQHCSALSPWLGLLPQTLGTASPAGERGCIPRWNAWTSRSVVVRSDGPCGLRPTRPKVETAQLAQRSGCFLIQHTESRSTSREHAVKFQQ